MITKQQANNDHSGISINRFDAQRDNRVKAIGPIEWAVLEEFFLDQPTVTTDKESVGLFNVANYKSVDEVNDPELIVITDNGEAFPRRKQLNIRYVDAFVLDFDGGMSIQEATQRFEDYSYVGYTSHSHLRDEGVEKFRLIIQLASPIPADMTLKSSGATTRSGDWFYIKDALAEFAGPADPKSFESNTMYFLPSCHPDRLNDYRSWSNQGAPFNWAKLPRSEAGDSTGQFVSDGSGRRQWNTTNFLHPDDILTTRIGPVRVGDIDRNIDGVVCPFHDDKVGGEFVARSPKGLIFLRCKYCKTVPMVLPDQQTPNTEELDTEYRLPPEYRLRAGKKIIKVQDVQFELPNVSCPFHDTSSKLATVKRLGIDEVQLTCKTCGSIEMDSEFDATRDPSKPYVSKSGKLVIYPPPQPNFDDLVEFDTARYTTYYDASDRSLVTKQLETICSAILNDKTTSRSTGISIPRNRTHILYMPEGSGKSLLAREMAVLGKKIFFACKSWDQAMEKYEEFKSFGDEHGFTVDLFLSKDGKARRVFNTSAARTHSNDPYRIGKIDTEKSIQKFMKENPELSEEFIRISWNFFTQDSLYDKDYVSEFDVPDGSSIDELSDHLSSTHFRKNATILVTTHAQLRTIFQREKRFPKDRIVWLDDPDISDIIDIERYDPKQWPGMSDDDVERRTTLINGRRYFKRDSRQSLGFSQMRNTCVYTTTESVTKQAIEIVLTKRKEKYVVYDKMNHLFRGNISILGTSTVRSKLDGIVPVLSRLLEKQGYNNLLIANGLATPLNHSNNKGNNKLKNNIILVELSIPHPHEVLTCYDALGIIPGSDRNEMARRITLDRMHQAIGRNSGYRWAGCECVILADSNHHKYLIENVRYKIDEANSVLIDRTQKMSRTERRTTDTVTDFVAAIESLILEVDQLVADARKIRPAIKYVFQQISDSDKTILYAARLLRSFASHADKDFWLNEDPEEATTNLEQTYKDLGDWMLQTCISREQRECALNEHQPQD